MALTTSIITGRVPLPDDANPAAAEIVFTLSGYDTEGNQVIPGGAKARFVLDDGDMPAGAKLWRNTEGLRGTAYAVEVAWSEAGRRETLRRTASLGVVQVGDDASYTLAELLNATPVPVPDNTYWLSITQQDYDDMMAAKDDAEAAAAQAALFDGPRLTTVSDLIEDTALTYDPGEPTTVEEGDIVRVDEGAFAYEVLPSSATDYGLITGEGVKLMPKSSDLLAWGYRPGDDAGALSNKAWRLLPADDAGWKTLHLSAGHYLFRTSLEMPHQSTLDVGPGVTLELAHHAYDNLIRNANARAMRRDTSFTTDDLGNPVKNDQGIRAAVAAYNGPATAGEIVWINGFRYEAMATGHEFYDAIPTDMRGSRGDNLRFRPARDSFRILLQPDTRIIGNGEFNRSIPPSEAPGAPGTFVQAAYREVLFNFGFADDYVVSGGIFINTARWAISNEHSNNGRFLNITFDQPGWNGRPSAPDPLALGYADWRTMQGLPNQDGLNFRKGCTNMLVDGIHGKTGDDCIAFTNLYKSNNNASERDNHFSASWSPYGAGNLFCTIRGGTAKPIGSHHCLRITSSDNNLCRFITVDGWDDFTTEVDLAGNEYGRVNHESFAVIGDCRYGDNPSEGYAIRDIFLSNIVTSARNAVHFKGPSRLVYVDNLTAVADASMGSDKVSQTNSVIRFDRGELPPAHKVVAITKSSPAQVTTSGDHGLTTGDVVELANILGMTEVNNTTATVTVTGDKTVTLDGVDSTGFTDFTPGGTSTQNRMCRSNYLVQQDHVFSGVRAGRLTTSFGSNAGWVIDARAGSHVLRCSVIDLDVFAARSVVCVTDPFSSYNNLHIDGIHIYRIEGRFLYSTGGASFTQSQSNSIKNMSWDGSRPFNMSEIGGLPLGAFYQTSFPFLMDETAPEVTTAEDSSIIVPSMLPGSKVRFAAGVLTGVGFPTLARRTSSPSRWVAEKDLSSGLDAGNRHVTVTFSGTSPIYLRTPFGFTSWDQVPYGAVFRGVIPVTNSGGVGVWIDDASALAGRTPTLAVISASYIVAGRVYEFEKVDDSGTARCIIRPTF